MSMVAASQGVSITTWLAVAAVIVDSIVTCFVGWRLNKTARRETAKAAETVRPALNDAINSAVVTLLPLLVDTVKQHMGEKAQEGSVTSSDNTVRAIQPIHNKSGAV